MTTLPRRPLALLLALAVGLVMAVPVAAATPPVRASDAAAPGGRFIVAWRDDAPNHLAIAGVRRTEPSRSGQRSLVVARAGEAGKVGAALRADPRVLLVTPDAVVKESAWPADGDPSDTFFADQEDLEQIRVPEVWPTTIGDPGLVIAVLDSGVDLDHPDLAGVTVVAPRNEIWNNTDIADDNGHGTHVAGTILARTDNGTGIAGIAPGASLMPIKVLDETGSGFFSDVLDGMDWARTHGADVVNLSLGGILEPAQVALIQPTFTAARAAGLLVVAASGNSGSAIMEYPAGLNGVVSVAAVDQSDLQAEFSTFNRGVDISAPGVDILSTTAGDYEEESGTSMASPHVAGVAALIWSARPSLSVGRAGGGPAGQRRRSRRPGSRQRLWLRSRRCRSGPGRSRPESAARSRARPRLHRPADDHVQFAGRAPEAGLAKRRCRLDHEPRRHRRHRPAPVVAASSAVSARTRSSSPTTMSSCSTSRAPSTRPASRSASCYRWDALAIDEDAQLAETVSEPVSIVDTTRPRIKIADADVRRDAASRRRRRSRSSSPSPSRASRDRRSG